jgi:putative photosynthetic complex assembly protein
MSEPFNHARSHEAPIGRAPLLAVGALLALTILGAATVRMTGSANVMPDADVVASRSLRFEDRPDGSVAVISAKSGLELQRIEGESGFVRGALRGLARERRRAGMGPEQPFVLTAHADGRITLLDPVTERRIDLASFGAINPQPFVAMLRQPEPAAVLAQ